MPAKKTNPFPLKSFLGVDPEHLAYLAAQGIKTAPQLLAAAVTPNQRQALAQRTGVPEVALLELAQLSDLARLYHSAGICSVQQLAACEPDALLRLTAEFVARSGFPGIPPLPKEVSSTIANARNLPILLET